MLCSGQQLMLLPNANDELAGPEKAHEMVQEHPFQAMIPDQLICAVWIISARDA